MNPMLSHANPMRLPGRLLVRLLACLLVAGLGATLWPTHALAEDVLEGTPVVRRNSLYRQGRHELAAVFGATLGDPYVRNLLPGVRYDFHLRDWLALGADVLVGVPVATPASQTIEAKILASKVNPNFTMETTHLRFLSGAHVSVAPLVGKFIAFGSLPVNFDFHVNLSIGVASVSGTPNIPQTISVAPGIGGGVRVFVSRVVALTFDLSDVFVSRTLAVTRDSKATPPSYQDSLLFTGGLSFFMPPDLDRAE
jgi:hypothetical protein